VRKNCWKTKKDASTSNHVTCFMLQYNSCEYWCHSAFLWRWMSLIGGWLYRLAQTQQFCSYITTTTSSFSMRSWWHPLCTSPTSLVGFL
jgi:hypothetical protein